MLADSEERRPSRDPGQTGRSAPHRRCIASRVSSPRDSLIRFVVDPQGVVTPDLAERLPGRGLWVSASRPLLEKAAAKGLFLRAARRAGVSDPIVVPDGLGDRVADLLQTRCRETLSLARRSGQAVAGFEKVQSWLGTGRAVMILIASDAADATRRRMVEAARRAGVPAIVLLDSSTLGRAFGRDSMVHVAVAGGGLAERLARDTGRLGGFRPAIASVVGVKVDEVGQGADHAAAAGAQ